MFAGEAEGRGDGLAEYSVAADDDAGVLAGGPDVPLSHGADGGVVLIGDAFQGPAAVANVAGKAARKAGGVFEIDIDAGVEELPEFRPVKGKEAFYDDVGMRLDMLRAWAAGVAGEVVVGYIDGLAAEKLTAVGQEEFVIDGGGFVEIGFGADFEGKVCEVVVIAVERENGRL